MDSDVGDYIRSGTVRALAAVVLLLGVARCDWNAPPADEEELVVESFLETGQPLPDITLRQTAPLQSGGAARNAASGAEVVLHYDGTRIPYREHSQQSGRYVPTADSVVKPDRSWQLTVRWRDEQARAQGRTSRPITMNEVCVQVPRDPVQAVRVDSLRRDSLDIPATTDYIYPMDVRVRWDRDPQASSAGSVSWVRTQLRPDASSFSSQVVAFFLEPAEIQREDAFSRVNGERQWQGVYAVPVDSSEPDLFPTHDLTAALVRGDTAFAEFAQTRTDPDRREPISNVDGGLGIATAVAVDSIVVEEVTEPGRTRCVEAR